MYCEIKWNGTAECLDEIRKIMPPKTECAMAGGKLLITRDLKTAEKHNFEGMLIAKKGDVIIRGALGEIFVMSADEFHAMNWERKREKR